MKRLIFCLVALVAVSVITSCEDVYGKQIPINMNKLKCIIGVSNSKSVINVVYLCVIYVTR